MKLEVGPASATLRVFKKFDDKKIVLGNLHHALFSLLDFLTFVVWDR